MLPFDGLMSSVDHSLHSTKVDMNNPVSANGCSSLGFENPLVSVKNLAPHHTRANYFQAEADKFMSEQSSSSHSNINFDLESKEEIDEIIADLTYSSTNDSNYIPPNAPKHLLCCNNCFVLDAPHVNKQVIKWHRDPSVFVKGKNSSF